MYTFYIRASDSATHLGKGVSLFNESPPLDFEYLSVKLGNYVLEGRELLMDGNVEKIKTCLYAIHGARSDYTKLNPVLYPLQRLGVPSLSFSLSGHSLISGVKLKSTSLNKNLQECLHFFGSKKMPIRNILGSSLGGALALKVAEVHKSSVERIVLLAPALYTEEAYNVPFGAKFKAVISAPFGFLDSKSLSFLKNFKGKVLLVMGEHDGLSARKFGHSSGTSAGNIIFKNKTSTLNSYYSAIPSEVIAALEKNIESDRLQKIILKGCDHSIMLWLRNNPDVAQKLSQEIDLFLK